MILIHDWEGLEWPCPQPLLPEHCRKYIFLAVLETRLAKSTLRGTAQFVPSNLLQRLIETGKQKNITSTKRISQ